MIIMGFPFLAPRLLVLPLNGLKVTASEGPRLGGSLGIGRLWGKFRVVSLKMADVDEAQVRKPTSVPVGIAIPQPSCSTAC